VSDLSWPGIPAAVAPDATDVGMGTPNTVLVLPYRVWNVHQSAHGHEDMPYTGPLEQLLATIDTVNNGRVYRSNTVTKKYPRWTSWSLSTASVPCAPSRPTPTPSCRTATARYAACLPATRRRRPTNSAPSSPLATSGETGGCRVRGPLPRHPVRSGDSAVSMIMPFDGARHGAGGLPFLLKPLDAVGELYCGVERGASAHREGR